jgi:hypothetical protein
MWRRWISALIAIGLVLASWNAVLAEKHYEDAVGDAEGDAPDIVSVRVGKPEDEDTIRFDIEFAPERPFGSDMQTWTDVVFVAMSATAETDERGVLSSDVYTTGTHGATLARQAETGAFLVTDDEMYWYVVDVDVAGPVISFTFDRKLLDFYPIDLYWQVLVGVEREEPVGDEGDVYPELDEPPAHYRYGQPDDG